MMIYLKMFFSAVFISALLAIPALAEDKPTIKYYHYAHNEAEYSIALPEAPTVKTICGEDENIPYLMNPVKHGFLGETAVFKEVDINTEDSFEANIYFLKAKKEFLSWLNEKRIKNALKNEYSHIQMTDENFAFSDGTGGLKWASITGFSVEQNRPIFHAMHYLTGQKSIHVIRVKYNVENVLFHEYYDTLVNSVKYHSM